MYKINELAKIAGISTRTLRYYDDINLLKPALITESGYRMYSNIEVDLLQQIQFFKELDYDLKQIKKIITKDNFDIKESLINHYDELHKKKNRIDRLLDLVIDTISNIERNEIMNDDLKFEAFKEDQILKNTNEYGDELNKNYGKEFIKKSNRKYKNKTSEEFKVHDELTKKLNETMKKAIIEGNPSSDLSMKMCQIHKEWLMFYWPSYDKNHHLSLTEMYTLDDRFRKYYDDISEGLSDFLYKAMKLFVNK